LNEDLSYFRAVLTGAPVVIVSHPKYGESSLTHVVIDREPAKLVRYGGYQPGEPTLAESADCESGHRSTGKA
jgi:hypothetical protein